MKKKFQSINLQAVFTFLLLCVHVFASGGEIIQISASTRHLIPKGKEVDAHVIVVATGKEREPGNKKGKHAMQYIAIANPFFIDVDGNGFVANKDLLDKPLPVGKKTDKKKSKKASDNEDNEN